MFWRADFLISSCLGFACWDLPSLWRETPRSLLSFRVYFIWILWEMVKCLPGMIYTTQISWNYSSSLKLNLPSTLIIILRLLEAARDCWWLSSSPLSFIFCWGHLTQIISFFWGLAWIFLQAWLKANPKHTHFPSFEGFKIWLIWIGKEQWGSYWVIDFLEVIFSSRIQAKRRNW